MKLAQRKNSGGGGNTKSDGKLSLSKSFKSALTTHVNLSDKEADFIMETVESEHKDKLGKE